MITSEELAEYIILGHELTNLEFKGPGDRADDAFFAKVARACLGLSNHRDGGHVVIGIDDSNPAGSIGLTEEQIAEWLDYDRVADRLHKYADPAINFERAQLETPAGAKVVALHIREFELTPIICKADYGKTLYRGNLYARSHHKPESTTPGPAEMRAILDLATEKRVRQFLLQMNRIGFDTRQVAKILNAADELFDDQLGDHA